jgi:hypothetical protein
MTRRRVTLTLLATALIAVSGVAAYSGLHGTHTTPRPQVVGDGQVVVDAAALNQDGFVVVRRDADGRPGEPIGSEPVEPGIHEDITVSLDEPLGEGTTPLWAAIHRNDGDESFDPEEDPAVEGVVGIAASPFEVRTGEGSAYVLGSTEESQPSNDSVLVNQVALPEDGHLVVRTDDRNRLGEVIGNASLSAGTHYNVVVDVNASAYPEDREYVNVWGVVYGDDGNGTFEADEDSPLTVGEDPVASRIRLQLVNGSPERTTVSTPAPTTSSTDDAPGGNANPGDGTGPTTSAPTEASGEAGPGFGATVAALALALVGIALLAIRRHGR